MTATMYERRTTIGQQRGRQATPPRLLPGDRRPVGLQRHRQMHGPLPYRNTPADLIEDVRAAGLTGRGGAAFPAADKMAAVAANSSRRGRPVVVANGAEGEPASHKDKHLLWLSPHLVLDGLQLAADAVGADQAYIYVHRNDGSEQEDPLYRHVAEAIAQRSAAGTDRLTVQVVSAPPRFLAGQESALANKVGGGPALPTFARPRVYERGVGGSPTLVQNVETLAHIALIARYGPTWFRRAGSEAEPGTMLVTSYRSNGAAVVTEAEIGTSIGALLGLTDSPAQAVLTGGYHGTWIGGSQASQLSLTRASLDQASGVLGAGVLAALPHGRCGLAETARVASYLASESARQCGPCLAGLPRIADALARLAGPYPDPRILGQLRRWTGLVEGRGACSHPDGSVRFVRSALTVFASEIARHQSGTCTARARGGTTEPFLPIPDRTATSRDDWS